MADKTIDGVALNAEKIAACARVMGLEGGAARLFNPLLHDSDAMALVKHLRLLITPVLNRGLDVLWCVTDYKGDGHSSNSTLNHAIVSVAAARDKEYADAQLAREKAAAATDSEGGHR